jgi:hypothetical protein
MENHHGTHAGFDERAALDELERVRQEIERYRAKRKALSEEFDEFVRSFKTPPQSSVPQPRPQPEPQKGRLPDIPATHREDRAAVAPPPDVPAALAHRRPGKTPALLAGAFILLAAGGWVTWIVRTRASHSAAAAPVPDTRPSAPSVSRAAAESANRSAPSVSELTTTRPVWVRVLADGERVVERELPANARVPLTSQKTIVIRAGNAGAVRVTLAGQDQGVLGPEGTVVTRTFSVPRTPSR